MKNTNTVMVAITISCCITLFTGCELQKTSPKSVQYYKEHKDERKAKIKECLNDVAAHQDDEDCKNAMAAERTDFVLPDLNRSVNKSFDKF